MLSVKLGSGSAIWVSGESTCQPALLVCGPMWFTLMSSTMASRPSSTSIIDSTQWMLDQRCERDVFVDEVEDPLRPVVVEQRGDVDEADAHVVGSDRPRRVELLGLAPANAALHPLDLVIAAAPYSKSTSST